MKKRGKPAAPPGLGPAAAPLPPGLAVARPGQSGGAGVLPLSPGAAGRGAVSPRGPQDRGGLGVPGTGSVAESRRWARRPRRAPFPPPRLRQRPVPSGPGRGWVTEPRLITRPGDAALPPWRRVAQRGAQRRREAARREGHFPCSGD